MFSNDTWSCCLSAFQSGASSAAEGGAAATPVTVMAVKKKAKPAATTDAPAVISNGNGDVAVGKKRPAPEGAESEGPAEGTVSKAARINDEE